MARVTHHTTHGAEFLKLLAALFLRRFRDVLFDIRNLMLKSPGEKRIPQTRLYGGVKGVYW